MRHFTWLAAAACAFASTAHAGPFTTPTSIGKDNPAITNWATGYQDYLPGTGVDAVWKTPAKALGKAEGTSFDVVVLGDNGRITLTFGGSIVNGAGADFAVFENSFDDNFLELARVEVSSNGSTFVRFSAISLTANPVGGFGTIDPTNIIGFAGRYRQGVGTMFDLDELKGAPGLDVNNVRYVRIVDVVGDGTAFDDYPVAFGGPKPIYDPYPLTGSAGFDLDAIGVMHFVAAAPVPEPGQFALFGAGILLLSHVVRRRQRHIAATQA